MLEEKGYFVELPQDKYDYTPHDIYRNLTRKEKMLQDEQIRKNTVKFASELDKEILPKMPIVKNHIFKAGALRAQRQFLGIIAERQARLQAQIEWLQAEQEKHRND